MTFVYIYNTRNFITIQTNCFSSYIHEVLSGLIRIQCYEHFGPIAFKRRRNPAARNVQFGPTLINNPSTSLIWRKYATYSFVIKYSRAQNKFSIPGFMSKNYSKCARPPKLPGKRSGQCSQSSFFFYHFPQKSSIHGLRNGQH